MRTRTCCCGWIAIGELPIEGNARRVSTIAEGAALSHTNGILKIQMAFRNSVITIKRQTNCSVSTINSTVTHKESETEYRIGWRTWNVASCNSVHASCERIRIVHVQYAIVWRLYG